MPVPSVIGDLSTTAASNGPAGSDLPSTVDDYMRAVQAIVRAEYDTQQTANAAFATAANLTTHTGSTTAHGISAFGATLVDDADAATARATLGLGTIATAAAPSGTVVGTTDTQTLTNKTIVAASNTITTAASGDLSATELNAALAELQAAITALESSVGGLGTVAVHTEYISITNGFISTGTGEDARYYDIDVTSRSLSAVANCDVRFVGGANASSTSGGLLKSGSVDAFEASPRLTSTTNLRIAIPSAGGTVQLAGRWTIIDHGA